MSIVYIGARPRAARPMSIACIGARPGIARLTRLPAGKALRTGCRLPPPARSRHRRARPLVTRALARSKDRVYSRSLSATGEGRRRRTLASSARSLARRSSSLGVAHSAPRADALLRPPPSPIALRGRDGRRANPAPLDASVAVVAAPPACSSSGPTGSPLPAARGREIALLPLAGLAAAYGWLLRPLLPRSSDEREAIGWSS
jgi:hypothetical protein